MTMSDQQDFAGWPQLARAVDEHGGVLLTTMRVLRTLSGAGKGGPAVGERISEELRRRALDHSPSLLPIMQDEEVTVFRPGRMGPEFARALNDPDADQRVVASVMRFLNESESESQRLFEALNKPKKRRRNKK